MAAEDKQVFSIDTNIMFQRKEIRKAEAKGDFTIATYNVLADFHIPKSRENTKLYQYCPTEDLYKKPLGINSNRHALLMKEVLYRCLVLYVNLKCTEPQITNCTNCREHKIQISFLLYVGSL